MNRDPAESALDAQNPWPGLRSFGEADGAFFFGRERETRNLLEIIERSAVAVLYGQSGLGKTSLLRAGLFAPLKSAGMLPVWIRLDHSVDAARLARQVLDALLAEFVRQRIEAPAPAPNETLWSYFHRVDADFWGPRNQLVMPVIVLDQFEELFTLGQLDAQAAARTEAFARELEAQFEQRPPASVREHLDRFPDEAAAYDPGRECVRFVISLREDYLPHLDAWRGRMPSMLARRYRLEQMGGEKALEVVRRAGGALVDDAVAREIVAFVAAGGGGVTLAGTRVEPAILSVVCNELNLRRLKAGLPRITRELLSGERSRIIEDFYERSFDGIAEPVREWIEDELLTASGHRDRAAIEDAHRAGIDAAPVAQLVDRRILHSEERNQVVWIEFTHDLLTEPALVSRNARHQKRAEADAALREAAVREKLKRSRVLTAIFGVMALAMAGGVLWVNALWREARDAKELAEQQTSLAEKEKMNAKLALQAELASAAEAIKEAERARQAEADAKNNLDTAQATAVKLGEQAIEGLRSEWLSPGYDSAKVVAASVLKIETLAKDPQFDKVPMLRVSRQLGLALAALVHSGRGEESACTQLANQADALADESAPLAAQAIEASATTHMAAGECLRLRGRSLEAGQRLQQSMLAALRLPPASAARHRLLILGALARGQAALERFDFRAARTALQDARALMSRPSPAPPSADRYEAIAWMMAAASIEAGLASGEDEALAVRQQAQKLTTGVPASVLKLPVWRYRALLSDQNLASALFVTGRYAAADDLAQSTRNGFEELITADPDHTEWQLRRDRSWRLRAEVLYAWGRQTEALTLLKEIENSSKGLKKEGNSARARHQVATSAWLQATYAESSFATKTARLQDAESDLDKLVRDAPDYGQGVRDLAIVQQAQGDLSRTESERRDLGESERMRYRNDAQRHYQRALATLGALGHASAYWDVAYLAGSLERQTGELALTRNEPSLALLAFKRAESRYRAVHMTEQNQVERVVRMAYPIRLASRSLRWMDRDQTAMETDRRLLETLGELRRREPSAFRAVDAAAWVYRMAAEDHRLKGRLTEAIQSQADALQIVGEAPAQRSRSTGDAALLDMHRWVKDYLRPKVLESKSKELLSALERLESTHNPVQMMRNQALREHEISPSTPGLPGNWEYLTRERMREPDLRLADEIDSLSKEGWEAVRARRLRLTFYGRDAHLMEVDVRNMAGAAGVVSTVITRARPAFRMTGDREAIKNYNSEQELILRTEAQARLYFRYWVMAQQVPNGSARVIDHPRDLEWAAQEQADFRAKVERTIEPLDVAPVEDGSWTATATVQIGASLAHVKLTLKRSGEVDVLLEGHKLDQLLLVTHRYSNGVRVRDESIVHQVTATREVRNKNWKRAAESQQIVIDHWLRSAAADRRKELPGEYLSLSWYHLLGGEPAMALEAAVAGLAINTEYLPLQTNRAHALLLLGRETEATDIYRSHIGERMPINDKLLWQDEILNDLDQFDKAGLKDPRFTAVRAMMQGVTK